ncbi:leucine-rich repeat and calponin homology domain-containing protein 2-like isoform X2 [Carassius auratus]|uniref:Leucine-rich repeat and calponin homology domain-containing protein 2-like isoform X2 n=1 Tax=Carassius auratus TaxID=7957 RepID=A0A6P6N9J6_CARAU|nr:leucine-rich repeat and calponin homology domain-containing protein 2-like isoform X2 [Carassius auratus]
MKMAANQGAVGPAVALQSQHYPNVAHWNPGVMQQQQHPLHTARSLERALEDAVCSGMLNISGRKLRDYPGLNYDLTDTTQADLSKNRFGEIPPEVCMFAPLELLNLYHNCIKVVPEAIINLQMLTYLNISRNQLSVLPKFLFSLPLKVLVVSNNKLLSIPEEIGKAKDLMELDISCNEIQVLPAQMGKLLTLRELNIRRNCLQVLPDELSDLPLIRLDFSCNKITEIPISYRKLKQLQHIILDNNPMQSPPAQICLKGKIHIFKYLNLQACQLDKKPDTLDLPSLGKRCLPQQLTDSMEDFYPSKNHGPDSGIGSDNGDKRLSATEPSDDDTMSLHSQVSETARADAHILLTKLDSNKDQDQYDFIDPNPDEEGILSEGDLQHNAPYVSCLKELERVLKTHQSKDKENWKEESGSEKEQLTEEDEDDLKEVLDLRKIAVQLLQQEQQNRRRSLICRAESLIHRRRAPGRAHRFLSHSGSSTKQRTPSQTVRSASLDEGSSSASALSGQPSSSCSFDGSLKSESSDSEPRWPEVPPVLNQNEDRRRNKYLRKDYLKDNDPKHTSRLCKGYLTKKESDWVLRQMTWPPQSLDLNPIEMVWGEMDHRLKSKDENGSKIGHSLKYKCQSARRNSSGNDNDCEEGMRSNEFTTTLTVFGLKPRSAFSRGNRQDSSSTEPSFTMRRKMEHLREEMEQIRLLQQNLESRLKVLLPDDVGAALMDGVVLCHLANHIRPRSVASIHVPSPAVPKLSMAKCRRNVENFLDACKKLGVPQDKLCLPHHILEERGLVKVGVTVQALLDLPSSKPNQLSTM